MPEHKSTPPVEYSTLTEDQKKKLLMDMMQIDATAVHVEWVKEELSRLNIQFLRD